GRRLRVRGPERRVEQSGRRPHALGVQRRDPRLHRPVHLQVPQARTVIRLVRRGGLVALLLLLAACAVRPVILVSIDGLRTDAIGSGTMPTLDALAADGVQAEWMNPSFPTLTFPNHYTLVTGLRPDRHGIVNNTMLDPVLGRFSLRDRDAVGDPRWWGGKPAWVTLQEHGGRAATMFWPGSEAPIAGQHPSDWRPFGATVRAAWHQSRLVVASAHGMAAAPPGQREYIDDWLAAAGLGIAAVDVITRGSSMGVNPADGAAADAVEAALAGRHEHAECWRKQE